MMKKLIYSILTLILTLGLFLSSAGCGHMDAPVIKVTGITIAPVGTVSVATGGTVTLSASVSPLNATEQGVTWSSGNPSRATVNSSTGVVTGVSAGTVGIIATAKDGSGVVADKSVTVIAIIPGTGVTIDGVIWATRNVDAPGTFAATPESPGMFYQWNRKTGWSVTDPRTSSPSGVTWNSSPDTGVSWVGVNNPCPTGWDVPTVAQRKRLTASESQWDDVKKGRTYGTAPNQIFLPAAKYRMDNGSLRVGEASGIYGISESNNVLYAETFQFSSSNKGVTQGNVNKAYATSVRCVKN